MADLEKQVEVGADWVEITAPLAMADGTRYAVDIAASTASAVYTADTDSAAVPPSAGIIGHPWVATGLRANADPREYTKQSGRFTWARAAGGKATLISTEAD